MTVPGIPYQNPLAYQGLMANAVPIKTFYRVPTYTDTKYPVGFMALIGKNPSSGAQGELWYLAYFDSTGRAIWTQLTTGISSPNVSQVETDSGLPSVVPDGSGLLKILGGTGCTVTGNGPGNTVTVSILTTGITWTVVSGSTSSMINNHGYFADNNTGVTFTLPASATIGDRFFVTGINSGGWKIAQNSGQYIRIGSALSTTGVTGYVSSNSIGDAITLVCFNTDTGFIAYQPPQGNITVV